MKIACLGGGPAGLYFAISMKLRDRAHDITVFERNRPDDTFGWGVVFSEETFDNITANDPLSAEEIRAHFAYWDDIAVYYRGQRVVSGGHGFSGIARKKLLMLLQERARELGVNLVFQTEIASAAALAKDYDLVVAADGLNSKTRKDFAEYFKPAIDLRKNKFVWLGTQQKFNDAFTFIFEETEHGWIWAHAYQFDADTATFIVECAEPTWQKFGFDAMSQDEILPHLRAHFCRLPRRPSADLECFPHSRFGVAEFSARALREVVAPEYRADGRRRRHGAFLHRLGHQARHGERGVHGGLPAQRVEHAGGIRQIRRRTPHRSAAAAIGGAQFHGMVRGRGALSPSRSGAIQLFAAHALPAHQPRELAAARQELARRRGGVVPAPRRRGRQRGAAADVRAVPAARHAA